MKKKIVLFLTGLFIYFQIAAQFCTRIEQAHCFYKTNARGVNSDDSPFQNSDSASYQVYVETIGKGSPTVISVYIDGNSFTAKSSRVLQPGAMEIGRHKNTLKKIVIKQQKGRQLWFLELEKAALPKKIPAFSEMKAGILVEWRCKGRIYFTPCPIVALASIDIN